MSGQLVGRWDNIGVRVILFATLFSQTHFTHSTFAAGLNRVANTTLRMPQRGTDSAFTTVDAFPGLSFVEPVAIVTPPGETDRVFVVERAGRIYVLNNLSRPTKTLFLDISDHVDSDYAGHAAEGLSSLAFHPGYKSNRFFFVTYTTQSSSSAGTGNHNRVARFQISATNPNSAVKSSERVLISQFDQGPGHNINDVKFGPDGYLYIATGDEGDGGTGDDFNNAQRIDKDFFSGILRIDVDRKPGNLAPNAHPASLGNYSIPVDNPYVNASSFNGVAVDPTKVRTEFYAVGLRNPWRISFDPANGTLYCGDVGQHHHDEINIIVKGGNYGWSYFEGTDPGPKAPAPGGFNSIGPVVQYDPGTGPNQGTTVIGGIVYRGNRFPELYGNYIFADFTSGNIWALNGGMQRLTGNAGIAGFGPDPSNGDVLMADMVEGKILRLERAPFTSGLPGTLAETGAFADLTTLTPNPGVVPFDVNVPFWSDNAIKRRWFSVPDPASKIHFLRDGNWTFPAGTVWVKHFDLEMVKGDPSSARRIETRLLVKNSEGVYGVTYRWGGSTDNAGLVSADGADETFQINDNGTIRQQTWHYPSRNECLICHTPIAGYALGFNTPQLNRTHNYDGLSQNQISALSRAGYFSGAADPTGARALVAADLNASLDARVRSYLSANCVQCHQPGGAGQGFWDARITTPTSSAGLINGKLMSSTDSEDRVVKPGSPEHSMLLRRLSAGGTSHMPPLATTVQNDEAIHLMTAWIMNDVTRPAVTIASPPAGRVLESPITLAGTARDNSGIGGVYVSVNSGGFFNADGSESWTASVSLVPGTNLVVVKAIDGTGNSSTVSRVYDYVVTSPIEITTDGPGTVTPNLNGQRLEVGKPYSITATPGAGYVFYRWSGVDATTASLHFTMQPNLRLQASFIPNPFIPLRGVYSGLIYDPNAPAPENAGPFQFNLSERGAFSGVLRLGGRSYPLSGAFNGGLSASKTISPAGSSDPLTVDLQLVDGTDQVRGTVRKGGVSIDLLGHRTQRTESLAGRYTAVLSTSAEGMPGGFGSLAVVVSPAGSARFSGTGADGAPLAGSAFLSAQGDWPFYVSMYQGHGAMFGWLVIDNSGGGDIRGRLFWIKPSVVSGLFSGGFSGAVDTIGSRFTAPVAGGSLFDPGADPVVMLQGGNLPETLVQSIVLNRNQISVGLPNPQRLRIAVSPGTGMFNGAFVHPGTGRTVLVRGVILQRLNAGGGYFPGSDQTGKVFVGDRGNRGSLP